MNLLKRTFSRYQLFIFSFAFITSFILLRSFLVKLSITETILCALIIFLFYYFVLHFLIKTKKTKKIFLVFLFIVGLISRLLMFGIAPEILSDDVYRYLWDGKMQVMGINPYLYAPEEKAVEAFRDKNNYQKINHKKFPTVYPPTAQLVFFLSYKIGKNSLNFMRIIYLFFDLLCVFFIYGFLKEKKFFVVYWLSPLIIIETFVGMHLDIIGISLLTGSVFFFQKEKLNVSAVFLALSVFVKYIAIAVVPIFIIYYLKRARRDRYSIKPLIKSSIFFILTAIFVFLPYLSAGTKIFKQFVLYTRYWQFNGFIYKALSLVSSDFGRLFSFIIMLSIVFYFYRSNKLSVEQKILYVLLSILFLSPVMYPWYYIWIIPFLIFVSIRAFYVMPMLLFISYQILVDYTSKRIWSESIVVLLIQYIPFFVILIYDFTRGRYVQKKENICNYTGS